MDQIMDHPYTGEHRRGASCQFMYPDDNSMCSRMEGEHGPVPTVQPGFPAESPAIVEARALAQQARTAYDAAAADYAVSAAKVAALLIRAKMPAAALVVFAQDEEVATADTSIDIVTVFDAAGEDLGEFDDAEYQREIEEQLCIAYDATDGAGPFDIGPEDDDPQYMWGPRNLLQLDIDALLPAPVVDDGWHTDGDICMKYQPGDGLMRGDGFPVTASDLDEDDVFTDPSVDPPVRWWRVTQVHQLSGGRIHLEFEDATCERCKQGPITDFDCGLCDDCTENNAGRVVL